MSKSARDRLVSNTEPEQTGTEHTADDEVDPEYLGAGMFSGAVLGLILGLALDSLALGASTGLSLGIAVGIALGQRANRGR